MSPELETVFANMPSLSQRQDGNMDQIADLEPFAAKLGLTKAHKKIEEILANYRHHDDTSIYSNEYPIHLKAALDAFQQIPESGMSEREEMYCLRSFSNKLGLYDASDTLRMIADAQNRPRM